MGSMHALLWLSETDRATWHWIARAWRENTDYRTYKEIQIVTTWLGLE